jgi:hypothetical protein
MDLSMHLDESKLSPGSGDERLMQNFNRRHLLRLWLRDPELAWETPAALKPRWDGLYKDVTEAEQVFPLEPRIRGGAGKV